MSRTTLSLIGLTAAGLLLSGCGTASTVQWQADGLPRHVYEGKDYPATYEFTYHPYAQVYYQPYTHTYYWNEDGEWYTGPVLPRHITVNPRHARFVHLTSPIPTAHHATAASMHGPMFEQHSPSSWQTVENLEPVELVDSDRALRVEAK